MTQHGFDAILCDLDGVIRHWPPQERLERRYGLPVGAIARAAFAPCRLGSALTGTVTDAHVVTAAWGSPQLSTFDDEVVAVLAQARRRLPVVVVTNATTRLEEDLRGSGLPTAVDAVISSARVGVAKPDPGIFSIAAEAAGVAVDRCLFVDDSATNVQAATALGMLGLLFHEVEQLRTVLTRLDDGDVP